jgi:molybdopterin synthase catalytic subunit
MSEPRLVVRIQEDPISVDAALEAVRRPDCGAVVLFLGTVRDHFQDNAVQGIEYEAHAGLALRSLQDIAREILAKWGLGGVSLVHRVGRLEAGELSVAIAVSSAHRREAFEAARCALDRIKESTPIWKRELFTGGDVWIEGDERVAARPASGPTSPGGGDTSGPTTTKGPIS